MTNNIFDYRLKIKIVFTFYNISLFIIGFVTYEYIYTEKCSQNITIKTLKKI